MVLGVLRVLVMLGVVCCVFTTPASPETLVPSGIVSGQWVRTGSPYVVGSGNITIPNGSSLKIEAGVTVEFRGHYKFIVNGHLKAGGLPTDSVLFTYAGPDSLPGWRGLRLIGADSTMFQYCIFEYGSATLGVGNDSVGGAAYVSGAGTVVKFLNCEFRHNYAGTNAGALYSGLNTTVKCYDCRFVGNGTNGDGGGAFLNSAHGSVFERCEFIDNTCNKIGGALHNRYTTASYIDCDFTQNTSHSSGGALVSTGHPSFRRCSFSYNTSEIAQGGAVYVYDSTAAATFDSCRFFRNRTLLRDAGAIYCWETSPVFTDCEFVENQSADDAGAIHAYRSGSNPSFVRCLIEGNECADEGGGIVISRYSKAMLRDCVVRENIAHGRGGGGIYLRLLAESLISDCLIENNSCAVSGGGVHVNSSTPVIENCRITGNTTDSLGGGVYGEGTWFALRDCEISGNTAGIHGGGVALYLSSPEVSRCAISENHADSLGGGVFLQQSLCPLVNTLIFENGSGVQGGGIYVRSSSPSLRHCTLADNLSLAAHAIGTEASAGEILNSVIANRLVSGDDETAPTGLGIEFGASAWTLRNSLFHRVGIPEFGGVVPPGFAEVTTTTANGDSCDGYGNVFASPNFERGLPHPYSLRTGGPSSPALNAGAPDVAVTDFTGRARTTGAANLPDMGCYETSQASSSDALAGTLSGTLSAGRYRVFGDIVVPADGKLVLEAGCELEFMGPYAVLVQGTLQSVGTAEDSILFISAPQSNRLSWRGLRFMGTESSQSVLSYVRIENCETAATDSSGGAIGIFGGASPLLHCCLIRNCRTAANGGGLRIVSGTPTVSHCVMEACSAQSGGGVRISNGQSLTLESCRMERCYATSGGALSLENGTLIVHRTSFSENTAQDGGAAFLRNGNATFGDCAFESNSATGSGGAIHASNSLLVLDSLLAAANSAQSGGALFGNALTGDLRCGRWSDNAAATLGGALYLISSELSVTRSLFEHNAANQGAALHLDNDSSRIVQCTIANNSATPGSAVSLMNSVTEIGSSQITHNQSGIYFESSSAANVNFCNFFNNRTGEFAYLDGIIIHGPNRIGQQDSQNHLDETCDRYDNTTENPQYLNWEQGDFTLVEGSACLDAGNPALDCDPDLSVAEIGAFHTPHATNPWVPERLTITVSDSGVVGLQWSASQQTRLCAGSSLWYQVEAQSESGEWSTVGAVQDTVFVVIVPDSLETPVPLRVRSMVGE